MCIRDRIKIAKAVSVTTKEREAFEKLVEMGIDVQIQMVPRDELLNMKDVLLSLIHIVTTNLYICC